MKTMMRDYPHLPLLSIARCFAVFDKAKLGDTMLAELTGLSRMSFYLWRRGRKPNKLAIEVVSTLAYRVLANLKAGRHATCDLAHISLADLDDSLLPANWK